MLVPGWVLPNQNNEMGQWWAQRGRVSLLGLFQSRRGKSPLRDEQCEGGQSLREFNEFWGLCLFDKVLVVFSPRPYPGWPKPLPVPLLGRMCQLLSSNCSLTLTLVELSSNFFKGRPLGHGATLCVVALVEAEPFWELLLSFPSEAPSCSPATTLKQDDFCHWRCLLLDMVLLGFAFTDSKLLKAFQLHSENH